MLYAEAWRRNVEVARDGSQRRERVIIVLRRRPDVRAQERRKLAERRLAATPRFRAGERTVSQSPTSDASLLAMRTPYFMFSIRGLSEALDEGVLLRLAGRDVVPVDLPLLRPAQDRHAGELGAVVGDDHGGPAARGDERHRARARPAARQRGVGDAAPGTPG